MNNIFRGWKKCLSSCYVEADVTFQISDIYVCAWSHSS